MTSDEGTNSIFNEAMFKMKRLHESQDLLNRIRINLMAYNEPLEQYNYQIFNSVVLSLIAEVEPKLSSKEKQTADDYKKLLLELEELFPVNSITTVQTLEGENTQNPFSKKNFNIHKEFLFSAESFARKMIEVHNLATPNEEKEEGWD